MHARDVMTSPVITAGPETTVIEIVNLMLDNRISAIPIVDDEENLIGLVSEGDLTRRSEIGTEYHRSWWLSAFGGAVTLAEDFVKSHGVKASEIMTDEVITADEDTPLWQIAETLERRKVKRLPVLRDGRVVGIVSRANLLQAVTAQRGKQADVPSQDDRTIRETLMDQLRQAPWSDMSHLNIVVLDGTVHFWGLVNTEAQRTALKVAAENIPGVSAVVDHTHRSMTLVAV